MKTLDVTAFMAAKVLWCVAWRSVLITNLLIMVAITLVGLLGLLGLGSGSAVSFDSPIDWIWLAPISIYVGIWVTRMALIKHYQDFDIVLIKRQPERLSEEAPVEPDLAPVSPSSPA